LNGDSVELPRLKIDHPPSSKYLKTQYPSRNRRPAEAIKSPFDGRKTPFGHFLIE